MSQIPPSLPFHLSRAYGTPAPAPRDQTPQTAAESVGRASPDELVAGRVNRTVDFVADQPPRPAEPLPFYRRPADRNTAATEIQAGRALDVRG